MYPRQSSTTHTEQLGDEASVYDWARAEVHALNPTAARVWRQCDGATSPDAIAAVLHREMGVPEAEAVVDLTLTQLTRAHLLELPVAARRDRPAMTRRWLLGRGVAAAMLPAIYSIMAPSPVEAQSTPAPGAPTLTSIAPNSGNPGTTVAVTLTGTNFVVGATTVTVSGSGVTVSSVTVSGTSAIASVKRAPSRPSTSRPAAVGTSLTANLVIDPAAAAGPRTVTVTTAGGTSPGQTFTISPAPPGAPTLTSVAPNQGIRGTTVAVTLTGAGFVAGATTVTVGGSGVTVTDVTVSSGTALTANFMLGPTAPDGARTVTVTTAAGTSGPRIFTVNLPAPSVPTLTSITPNEGIRGTTVAVTLTGVGFVVGATTVNISGGGVTVTSVAVSSGTSLTGNFVIDAAAAAGPRTVTVTTAAGTSGAQTFTVNLPPGPGTPTLTGVSPNQGLQGTTVAVTLMGTNFVVGATTVTVGGGGVTVTSVVVGTTTSLTASFVLDPTAAAGPRAVTVTTAGGTSVPQGFTVNLPPPTLTSVSPNQGIQGETVAVTLTGSNFVAAATTVNVSGAGVTVTNVVVGSGTSLSASFVVDAAAGLGARNVTVTTAAGTSAAQGFTIILPPPTLASVSPNQGAQGATIAVTLTGTYFVAGATTVNVTGGGVTVTSVVIGSTTSLTANFVIDPVAVVGPRVVTVTTAGGTSVLQGFTVNLPPPTLTSISPNRGVRANIVPVTLTGTNFVLGGTTVAVGGASGVTVVDVIVGSGTSLTASFVLAPTATFGARFVTVTTAGGTSNAQTFTVGGSSTFNFSGSPAIFPVPDGVVSVTIQATGAKGAEGTGAGGGASGDGGQATATMFVTPGASLTVRVGGTGILTSGGFNGGGNSTGAGGGGGGGASSVFNGTTPLVIAGGGGGGGAGAGSGAILAGRGGGCNGLSGDSGQNTSSGGNGGGGGTHSAGGAGGSSVAGTAGTAGVASLGGNGGSGPAGAIGGGGGGGGYFGGGGGGGGNPGVGGAPGGGGGSSFTAPGATDVVHVGRVGTGLGTVTITW